MGAVCRGTGIKMAVELVVAAPRDSVLGGPEQRDPSHSPLFPMKGDRKPYKLIPGWGKTMPDNRNQWDKTESPTEPFQRSVIPEKSQITVSGQTTHQARESLLWKLKGRYFCPAEPLPLWQWKGKNDQCQARECLQYKLSSSNPARPTAMYRMLSRTRLLLCSSNLTWLMSNQRMSSVKTEGGQLYKPSRTSCNVRKAKQTPVLLWRFTFNRTSDKP